MVKGLKLLVILAGVLLLGACQSTGKTSSHVSVGVVTGPGGQSFPQARPRGLNTQENESVPQSEPAPPAAPPSPTRVQVMPANPEQGVPLGDNTEVEITSLQPTAASDPVTTPAEAEEGPEENTWLQRFPHLAEDMQDYQEVINQLESELQHYRQQLNSLRQEVASRWGSDEVATSSAHQFVKYTDSYQSRGEMDFDQGRILVETLDQENPRQHLKQAIVTTLLTPYDAENPEIYSDRQIDYNGPALLAGQIKDHEGVPVRWEWRANRYADYLVNNEVKVINRGGQRVYQVEIPLVANHNQVRGQQYEHLVRAASERYGIDEALIYALMETESHFNPYATSHIPAYGLMQIVPATAGRDVYQRLRQRNDQPNRSVLFNPAENIDIGTGYLTILRDVYLKDIRHPLSREYAMISAYNGGAGNVLRTFDSDRREAVAVINQLSPQQVYNRLHRNHPRAEARGYIKKVTEALGRYRSLASAN